MHEGKPDSPERSNLRHVRLVPCLNHEGRGCRLRKVAEDVLNDARENRFSVRAVAKEDWKDMLAHKPKCGPTEQPLNEQPRPEVWLNPLEDGRGIPHPCLEADEGLPDRDERVGRFGTERAFLDCIGSVLKDRRHHGVRRLGPLVPAAELRSRCSWCFGSCRCASRSGMTFPPMALM